jgi:ribonuclease P protein component
VIGRIVRSVDFERVLSAPSRARSPHFAVHHVQGAPSVPRKPARKSVDQLAAHKLSTDLSTGQDGVKSQAVEDPVVTTSVAPVPPAAGVWMGVVVPKRYARRSVTRTLLKRQIRAAVARQHGADAGLPQGLWVVRLRSPFAVKDFPSAASDALRQAARGELDTLLADAVRRSART